MQIAVIGASHCTPEIDKLARKLGQEIAKLGVILVCGGLGGVMEAVSKGVKEKGGFTVGILPGNDANDKNPFIDISIVTGLGHARNVLVVKSADVVVALPGEYGTLSEIALALQMQKPVISLTSWDIKGTIRVKNISEAIEIIKKFKK